MAKEADKHPKDFVITKESGIKIIEQSFFDGTIPAEARMTGCVMENAEYGESRRLTLTFERHTESEVLEPARDFIEFSRMQTAKHTIGKLRGLADRLEESCVKALSKD